MNIDTKKFLQSEDQQLVKLQQIVQQAIDDEKSIVENLLHEPKELITTGQSISDTVASFGGSWKFIILFSIILFIWILFNTIFLSTLALCTLRREMVQR